MATKTNAKDRPQHMNKEASDGNRTPQVGPADLLGRLQRAQAGLEHGIRPFLELLSEQIDEWDSRISGIRQSLETGVVQMAEPYMDQETGLHEQQYLAHSLKVIIDKYNNTLATARKFDLPTPVLEPVSLVTLQVASLEAMTGKDAYDLLSPEQQYTVNTLVKVRAGEVINERTKPYDIAAVNGNGFALLLPRATKANAENVVNTRLSNILEFETRHMIDSALEHIPGYGGTTGTQYIQSVNISQWDGAESAVHLAGRTYGADAITKAIRDHQTFHVLRKTADDLLQDYLKKQ